MVPRGVGNLLATEHTKSWHVSDTHSPAEPNDTWVVFVRKVLCRQKNANNTLVHVESGLGISAPNSCSVGLKCLSYKLIIII